MNHNDSQSVDQGSDPVNRKIFAKTILAILLGMGASLLMLRIILYLNDASPENILGRVIEARAALPQIVAEEQDLVMVFGSSMVRAGFSARQFDREVNATGADIKSFNFGFGGLNPLFQDYLARRIREAFQAEDRRLKLAVLEFNPFQTTVSRHNGAKPAVDSFITMLGSTSELWDIAKADPTRGALLFNIRYLRNNISAQMTTSYFGQGLQAPRARSEIVEEESVAERRNELGEELGKRFDEEYPDFSGGNWIYDWQGAGTIPEERTAETLDVFTEYYNVVRSPKLLDGDRLNRIACCDIIDLNFDQELVDAYVRIIENFQQFSDRVEVILLPRNEDWIVNPPEAVARMEDVLAQLRERTGVTIKNFQQIDDITPEMYSDTTHLARYGGDVPFTHFLANEYGPWLSSP